MFLGGLWHGAAWNFVLWGFYQGLLLALEADEHLDLADAWVAAWLPGSEGQGIADVLFGDYPFTGKLPVAWPATPAW